MDPSGVARQRTRTGRVSKALKGRKVHHCTQCPKVYSRAEHLRRHQIIHDTEPQQCNHCGKLFYREDLFIKHRDKHVPSPQPTSSSIIVTSTSQAAMPATSTYSHTPEDSTHRLQLIPSHSPDFIANAATETLMSNAPQLPSQPVRARAHQLNHTAIPTSQTTSPSVPFTTSILAAFAPGAPPATSNHALPPDSPWPQLPLATPPNSQPRTASSAAALFFPPTYFSSHSFTFYHDDVREKTHLGIALDDLSKRAYLESYWLHFHPLFPILHKYSLHSNLHKTQGVLLAVVMAIGAVYGSEPSSQHHSHALHTYCSKYIQSNNVGSDPSAEHVQLVVLHEFICHFAAKRSPHSLTKAFHTAYDWLWNRQFNNQIPGLPNELQPKDGWRRTIQSQTFDRLLAACYILDSRHALLLGRSIHQSDLNAGLKFPFPCSLVMWDNPVPLQWDRGLAAHLVGAHLDSLLVSESSYIRMDCFQSALIVALYSASVLKSATQVPSHEIFRPEYEPTLLSVLNPHSSIRVMFRAVHLAATVPCQSLVSIAGESWFFSKKQSIEAFNWQRTSLRKWAFVSSLGESDSNLSGLGTNSAASLLTASLEAAQCAIWIIEEASVAQDLQISLAWGPDLAVYLATLVLWAVTFAGSTRTRVQDDTSVNVMTAADNAYSIAALGSKQDVKRQELQAAKAVIDEFVRRAKEDVQKVRQPSTRVHTAATRYDVVVTSSAISPPPAITNRSAHFPPFETIELWKAGVEKLINWTRWIFNLGKDRQSCAGELVQGTLRVLNLLGRSAWTRNWF